MMPKIDTKKFEKFIYGSNAPDGYDNKSYVEKISIFTVIKSETYYVGNDRTCIVSILVQPYNKEEIINQMQEYGYSIVE